MAIDLEDIQFLPKDMQAEIMKMKREHAQLLKEKSGANQFLNRIASNPIAKNSFNNAAIKAGVQSAVIPDNALDNYMNPVVNKVASLEREISRRDMVGKVRSKLNEKGFTDNDVPNIAKFQQENSITDPIKAIELYDKTQSFEITDSVTYQKPYTSLDNLRPEEELYKETAKQLRLLKR